MCIHKQYAYTNTHVILHKQLLGVSAPVSHFI